MSRPTVIFPGATTTGGGGGGAGAGDDQRLNYGDGTEIETSGKVRFEDAPGERGTRVSLVMAYDPPAGALGRAVAKLFLREPQVQARHDLKRFKMLMETGEIATSARTRDETRAAKQENG